MITVMNEPAGMAGDLMLEGIIDDYSFWGDEATPDQLQALLTGNNDITLWIQSPGGSVFAANKMYAMLKSYPGKVTIKILEAASAATLVALAADTLWMSPTGYFMIHEASAMAWGQVKEFNTAINALSETNEALARAYSNKSSIPIDEVKNMMAAETYMNGYRAKEKGFVDKLLFVDFETEETNKEGFLQNVNSTLPLVACAGRMPIRMADFKKPRNQKPAEPNSEDPPADEGEENKEPLPEEKPKELDDKAEYERQQALWLLKLKSQCTQPQTLI